MPMYPHVDVSGRGLDDGDCVYCGASGSLADGECPDRLRTALDEAVVSTGEDLDRYRTLVVSLLGPTVDITLHGGLPPHAGAYVYAVRSVLEELGHDVQAALVAEAKRRAGHRAL